MKNTYTQKEIIGILQDLVLQNERKSLDSAKAGEVDNLNYYGGKADAYRMTACWLDKIVIVEE